MEQLGETCRSDLQSAIEVLEFSDMFDINVVMRSLEKERPVFGGELDFQAALADQITLIYSGVRVEREILKPLGAHRAFIDLEVNLDGRQILLELKYKSKKHDYVVGDRTFRLKGQGAQDQGRYDCLKDISRLERFVEDHPGSCGYSILLTNDSSYWSVGRKLECQDREFRLTDGRRISGSLRWASGAGIGSIRGREAPITLKGIYTAEWSDYTKFVDRRNPDLRMLIVHVIPQIEPTARCSL